MNKSAGRIWMFLSVALLSGAVATAQQQPMGSAAPTNNPESNNPGMNPPDQMQQQQNAAMGSMQDKDFARAALEGGMAEVQLGQLAANKGTSPDVKQFGQKMVEDHTKLGDQLKPVAQQMGVKPPKGLSKKDEALVEKLQSLSGTDFDKAYIEAMVKDHKKDLADFKQEAENTQNPQLKDTAQQGMQVIDEHLHMIEQIAKAHDVKA